MNRLLSAALSLTAQSTAVAKRVAREMAVTVDDLPTASVVQQTPDAAARLTADPLSALKRHHVPAIGFVNEGRLHVDGARDSGRVALLQPWIDAGLELGNHTYSHADLHQVPASSYIAEIDHPRGASAVTTAHIGAPR